MNLINVVIEFHLHVNFVFASGNQTDLPKLKENLILKRFKIVQKYYFLQQGDDL